MLMELAMVEQCYQAVREVDTGANVMGKSDKEVFRCLKQHLVEGGLSAVGCRHEGPVAGGLTI